MDRVKTMSLPISLRVSLLLLLLVPSVAAAPLQPSTTGVGSTPTQPQTTVRCQIGDTEPEACRSPFGMNSYFSGLERISRDGSAGTATLMERGRAMGVVWAREELSWATIEASGKGRWNWSHVDQRFREAADAGYQLSAMLLTTPAWARVVDCSARTLRYAAAGVRAEAYWCPPASAEQFADFVTAAVERYDGDGNADAPGSPRVAIWQIWNEPNAWETWPGSPAEYAALLEAGYHAAKAADPTAAVATAGLYIFDGGWNDGIGHRDGLSFLNDALSAQPTAWGSFDALAVHPYMPTAAPDEPGLFGAVSLWGRLTMAQNWLAAQTAARGGTARPLWISEIGWSTCSSSDPDCPSGTSTPADQPQGHWKGEHNPSSILLRHGPWTAEADRPAGPIGRSEEQQANYLVRSHGIALALGVEHINWFQLEDKFDGAAGNFWEEAALLRTAALGYAPKPAAIAYGVLTSQLAGARFEGFGALHTFQHNPNGLEPEARFHLRFRDADDQLIELLWRNQGTESILLPREPGTTTAEVIARDGSPLAAPIEAAAIGLNLSEAPIYVRQGTPPELVLSREELLHMVPLGAAAESFELQITNRGHGTISWSASSSAAWLRIEPPVGTTQQSLVHVIVDPMGLPLGLYQATLQINSSAGNQALPVRLLIAAEVTQLYLPLIQR